MPSDNKLQNAADLGLLNGQKNFNGFVGKSDKVDSYRFSVSSKSSLSVSLSGLRANANIRLLNANGVVIVDSKQKGNRVEKIDATLDAGTFFLQVYRKKGNTSYRLQAIGQVIPSPVPAPAPAPTPVVNPLTYPSPEPGQSLRSAYDIGVVDSVKGIQDFVSTDDPRDYYKFTLSNPTPFSAAVSGTTSTTGLWLIYDANDNGWIDRNEVLNSDSYNLDNDYYNTKIREVSRNLDRGTYFLQVYNGRLNYRTNYTLTLAPSSQISPFPSPNPTPAYPEISPTTPPFDPGSSVSIAYNTGILDGNRVYKEFVGSKVGIADGEDFYKFTLNRVADFTVNVSGTTSTVGLELIYDANGNGQIDRGEILESDAYNLDNDYYNTSVRSVGRNLDPGSYFVRVLNGKTGYGTNYTLRMSA
jgi:Bacterial pre-peptidase C-terminal domain